MTTITDSPLDVPRNPPIRDADQYLRDAVRWHFSEETGSPFWLGKSSQLDFDPLTDIVTFADLRKFPDVSGDLRGASVQDLLPRGYAAQGLVPSVFESGGTTGAPKRTIQTPDWIEQAIAWQADDLSAAGYARGSGMLGLVPAGPHGIGDTMRRVAAALGSVFHTIDLDPRWTKKLIARNASAEATAYVDHIVDQAGHILLADHIGNLFTTPPIISAIARREPLVEKIRDEVAFMVLAGTQLDPDTYFLLRAMFPGTTITMVYGNTMTLAPARTRVTLPDDGVFVFDARAPYVAFEVVDPESGERVAVGERGQLLAHHVSKVMFIPNNLERDSAIRVAGPDGGFSDAIAAVAPVESFDGEAVIEGVY